MELEALIVAIAVVVALGLIVWLAAKLKPEQMNLSILSRVLDIRFEWHNPSRENSGSGSAKEVGKPEVDPREIP